MAHGRKRGLLLATLLEDPQTVVCIHLLTRGDCNVYMSGDQRLGLTAVLQPKALPAEPVGFGSDANTLWQELSQVKGWQCILVDKEVAPALAKIISSQLKTRVCFLDDIYHIPRRQVMSFENESVRRLVLSDLPALEALPREAQPVGFWGDLRTSLTKGLVAGAVVEGKIAATSFVAARGQRYVDCGVYALENHRRRGLATAAASVVARSVQSDGLVPVWGCGSHNLPSLKLVRKLGFVEVSRRTYVIIQKYLAEVSRRTYPVHSDRKGKAAPQDSPST
jgi:ribosomal protein S18 acetylase RimI-like enzyme